MKDLSDTVFGRLTAISHERKRDSVGVSVIYWVCRCECGNQVSVRAKYLNNGDTRSCGCLQRETVAAMNKSHGLFSGRSEWPKGYAIWSQMKDRCCNPRNKRYKDYGGRGIKVCDRWLDRFDIFISDMGEPPQGFSIERVKNDEGYSPDNCKWIPLADQAKNRRPRRLKAP